MSNRISIEAAAWGAPVRPGGAWTVAVIRRGVRGEYVDVRGLLDTPISATYQGSIIELIGQPVEVLGQCNCQSCIRDIALRWVARIPGAPAHRQYLTCVRSASLAVAATEGA